LRYAFVAWMAVRYGRQIIHLWAGTLAKWQTPLLVAFITIIAAGLAMGIWKLRRPARPSNTIRPQRVPTNFFAVSKARSDKQLAILSEAQRRRRIGGCFHNARPTAKAVIRSEAFFSGVEGPAFRIGEPKPAI